MYVCIIINERVKEFVYLASMFTRDGKCVSDIERRANAGNIVNGAPFILHAFMDSVYEEFDDSGKKKVCKKVISAYPKGKRASCYVCM
jgi:hypothetical protein